MTPVSEVRVIPFHSVMVTLISSWKSANYLNDLWIFDTQEYKWKQIELKDNERKPS